MDMNHDIDALNELAHQFVRNFANDGPDFLRAHLPERFIVGTSSGARTVEREYFIQAAIQRANLVSNKGLQAPELVTTKTVGLGNSYCLVTASWTMAPSPDQMLTLVEDFLLDCTSDNWVCLAYLLRQDLPGLLN